MSDRTFERKKAATSTFSHPSLVSPHTPTLANPDRGFGLPTNNIVQAQTVESANQQAAQAADEKSKLLQALEQPSFGHELSRISFRPQTKLTVGEPGDKYEQEADWMANQVMRMPEPAPPVQPEALSKDDEAVQRKAIAISSVNDGFLQLKCSESEQAAQSTDEQSLLSPAIQQRSFGHDLSRIAVRPPQAKLTVGEPGDKYEQEADWMANQVMRMVVPDKLNAQSVHSVQDSLQRKCAACEEEEDKVQTKPSIQTATDGGLQAGNNIQSRLNSSKGGGSPLPDEVRGFMEPRFGADFSQVRVHTGSDAVQMNRDLNAQAFTHKQDVYFGAGKSPAKDALTAHELTHVVQQIGIVQRQTATAGGDPECPDLLKQIRRFIFGDENTKGLIQRWEELQADPQNLQWDYWTNPHPQYGSVEGHQQQFRNMQQGLRNRLNQWNSKNCDDPDGTVQLPENAWDWATRQAPVPVPRERPAPSSSRSVSVSDVIDVLVTLGLSIALVAVVIAALADPEPASKLALAGLSLGMITLLLTRLGIQSDSGGSTA